MPFNPRDYLHFLEGFDLTEEEKLEHIRAVGNAMENSVDRAWGIAPSSLHPREASTIDDNTFVLTKTSSIWQTLT